MKYNLNNLECLLQNQETINKISIMLKTTPFHFKDYCVEAKLTGEYQL
jgi:hypothetical protein